MAIPPLHIPHRKLSVFAVVTILTSYYYDSSNIVKFFYDANNLTESIPLEIATNFIFPTPEERLKYYMGDWDGRSLTTQEIPCHKLSIINEVVSDKHMLWSRVGTEHAIRKNRTKQWMIRDYLEDAFDVMKHNEFTNKDEAYILLFGDSHTRATDLPVIAKTRFSRYAIENSTGKPFYAPIIWPMEMGRHYNPVYQYNKLYEDGSVCAWDEKKSTLIWRGAFTGSIGIKNLTTAYPYGGPRFHVVSTYFVANTSDVNVAFQRGHSTLNPRTVPPKYREATRLTSANDTSMLDQLKYKYILVLEGNDVATGLKWQLASNSVVFMAKPTTVSFLMEDILVPFVHYVPVRDDFSNLVEMVHWARKNDKKCKWISEQATLYMQQLWTSKKASEENNDIKKKLSVSYQTQFGEAVTSCLIQQR